MRRPRKIPPQRASGWGDFFYPETTALKTERVSFYIDGFNIYHRIRDHHHKTGKNYRWLDYRSFCESLLQPHQTITDIYFFTAIPTDYPQETIERHSYFINALSARNITIIKGYFSRRKEKQTDVNIATQIIVDAVKKRYDKCFLFSGDNDFVAALKAVKEVNEKAKAILITPPYEKRRNMNMRPLEEVVEEVIEVRFSRFDGHSLPAEIQTKRGGIITKPPEYDLF